MTQEEQVRQLVTRILENLELDVEEKDVVKYAEPLINRKMEELTKLSKANFTQMGDDITKFLKQHDDGVRKVLMEQAKTLQDAIAVSVQQQGANKVKFVEADMKRIADEVFQSGFTASVAASLKSGQSTPLPPLLPVDKFFVEDAYVTKRIDYAIRSRRHIMASGPSGSGKTFPLENMLRKHGQRYLKVSVADGLALSDFLAKPAARATGTGTETFYTYGFLPIAMLNGMGLILDEIDQCQPEIISVLNAVLETGRIFIPQTGETIEAKQGFQVFMTCNTLRDDTGNYSGFRLNAALLNRIVFVKCDYLPAKTEASILARVGLTPTNAEKLVGIFNGLRAAYEARKLTAAPSTRIAVRIARCMLGQDEEGNKCVEQLSPQEAMDFCLLDGLPAAEHREAAAIITNGL
jgi:MoxR-like ATPase